MFTKYKKYKTKYLKTLYAGSESSLPESIFTSGSVNGTMISSDGKLEYSYRLVDDSPEISALAVEYKDLTLKIIGYNDKIIKPVIEAIKTTVLDYYGYSEFFSWCKYYYDFNSITHNLLPIDSFIEITKLLKQLPPYLSLPEFDFQGYDTPIIMGKEENKKIMNDVLKLLNLTLDDVNYRNAFEVIRKYSQFYCGAIIDRLFIDKIKLFINKILEKDDEPFENEEDYKFNEILLEIMDTIYKNSGLEKAECLKVLDYFLSDYKFLLHSSHIFHLEKTYRDMAIILGTPMSEFGVLKFPSSSGCSIYYCQVRDLTIADQSRLMGITVRFLKADPKAQEHVLISTNFMNIIRGIQPKNLSLKLHSFCAYIFGKEIIYCSPYTTMRQILCNKLKDETELNNRFTDKPQLYDGCFMYGAEIKITISDRLKSLWFN